MIVLEGTIRIPKKAQAEALPALGAHIEATRQEAGNLVFNVTPDEAGPELYHIYKEFEDEAAFAAH